MTEATIKTTPIVFNLGVKTDLTKFFRKIIYTTKNIQTGLMTLKPGEDVGTETHQKTDQVFFVLSGKGVAVLKNTRRLIKKGDLIIVPARNKHNIKNTGKELLYLLTFYSPPHHIPGTVHQTKDDADEDKKDLSFGHNK